MLRCAVALALLCLLIAACSEDEGGWGDATLTIVNNSSHYVDGTIDSEKRYSYHLNANSNASYSIPVGSGMLYYSNVVIKANVHETSEASSSVVWSDTEKMRMKYGQSYEYVIPFSGAAGFHPRILERTPSRRSVTAP